MTALQDKLREDGKSTRKLNEKINTLLEELVRSDQRLEQYKEQKEMQVSVLKDQIRAHETSTASLVPQLENQVRILEAIVE